MPQTMEEAFVHTEDAVRRMYDGSPEDVKKIISNFRRHYENPPIPAIELMIHKNVSSEEVCVMLFNPMEEQVTHYVKIFEALAALTATSGSHKELEKVATLFLSLTFIVHRTQWSFLAKFIGEGGLNSLAHLIGCDNFYIRGQALEMMLSVTDCDSFDWFARPSSESIAQLHKEMLDLANQPHFLRNIFKNRLHTYPGGSLRALQLLAFWLSWVRALYTKDQVLELGKGVLDEMTLWCNNNGAGSDKMKEEIELANTLVDDFGLKQFEKRDGDDLDGSNPADASVQGDAQGMASYQAPSDWGVKAVDVLPEANSAPSLEGIVSTSNTSCNSTEISSASAVTLSISEIHGMKDQGNEYYKTATYNKALDVYRETLVHIDQYIESVIKLPSSHDGNTEKVSLGEANTLKISLHFNCATALWKLHERDPSESNKCILSECVGECEKVITMQNAHFKARYRMVSALLKIGQERDALMEAEKALAIITACGHDEDSSEPIEVSDGDEMISHYKMFKKLRATCQAAVIMAPTYNESHAEESKTFIRETSPTSGASPGQDAEMTCVDKSSMSKTNNHVVGTKTSKILAQLTNRKKREDSKVRHAWNGWTAPAEDADIASAEATSTSKSTQKPADSEYAGVCTNTPPKLSGKLSTLSLGIPEEIATPTYDLDDIDCDEDMVESNADGTRGLDTLADELGESKSTSRSASAVLAKLTGAASSQTSTKPSKGKKTSSKSVEKKGKNTSKKSTDSKKRCALPAGAVAAMAAVKKYTRMYECVKSDAEKMTIQRDAMSSFADYYAAGRVTSDADRLTLSAGVGDGLEEPLLFLIVDTAHTYMQHNNDDQSESLAQKLFVELSRCSRIETTLSMAVCGNDELKAKVRDCAKLCAGAEGSEAATDLYAKYM